MPSYPDTRNVITFALTTGDTALPVTFDPFILQDVNIHIYGADAYYGDSEHTVQAVQSSATPTCSIVRANAVVWFQNLVVKELWFKSYVTATPAYVVITGTVKK